MKQKGFTIIELIVVISIIAVLSVIITASVTGYIQHAKNAAMKANLDVVPGAATSFFSQNGTYGHFCEGSEALKVSNAVTRMGGIFTCLDPLNAYDWGGCGPSTEKWIAYIAYEGFGTLLNCYCVDSTGNKSDSCGYPDNCSCDG